MLFRHILAFGLFGLVSIGANAATLDFGIEAPTSGTISYAGGASPLIGTGIDVDSIVGLGTLLNADTPIACDGCILEFTTGANSGGWNFTGGGTISIVGGVPAAGVAGGTTLLTGTFDDAAVFDIGGDLFNFNILGASLFDTKDTDLLDYFGLPQTDYLGGMNISFSVTNPSALPGDAFTSALLYSGDVTNMPVPVPAAAWLFGSGLIGLVVVARRKLG